MQRTKFIIYAMILILIVASCTPAAKKSSELPVLKITALPIIDTLPIFVAQQEGLFTDAGVQVEFVPVASAPERDQLIISEQADGMINETLSTFFFNKEQTQIQIVRYALVPFTESGHFFILASEKSGITTPAELKGVEIGVSQGTIIEYVTYRLLEQEGFVNEEIKTIAVPKISDRLALLDSGQLSAAVLPDPLAALAVQQGAKVILDDSNFPQYGFSVYSFRKEKIDENPEAIKAFLVAIGQAVNLINNKPAGYMDILTEQNLVPAPLMETYRIPLFPRAGIPSEAEWNDAQVWAKKMGLLDVYVDYYGSVTADYIPEVSSVPQ